nr:Dihydrofolate reductase [uncultured bacterium]
MDRRRGIGRDNGLPWRLPADLKRFRELTMGHHIVVGRKTFESIGRPLPGREMIVVTRDRAYRAEGCAIVHSFEEALALARGRGEGEVFVCGGAEIYALALPLADRMYLTMVEAEVEADTFFPEWEERAWAERNVVRHESDERHSHPFTFKLLVREGGAGAAG